MMMLVTCRRGQRIHEVVFSARTATVPVPKGVNWWLRHNLKFGRSAR